ncbi:hypothetical protein HK101_010391, partial [Irineochytrium annulatum]
MDPANFLDDDQQNQSRSKFRRERNDEMNPNMAPMSYGSNPRRKRERSESLEDRRKRRRSLSPRGPMGMNRPGSNNPDGDHYVPNYDRDGYIPAPRHHGSGSNNFPVQGSSFDFNMMSGMMGGGSAAGTGRIGKIDDPLNLDYLMPYRQFVEFQKMKSRGERTGRGAAADMDEEELRKKYQTYKEAFQGKVLTTFFEEHKESEWFREKYHPVDCVPLKQEVNSRKRAFFPKFMDDLNAGKLDDISFDEYTSPESASGAGEVAVAASEVKEDAGGVAESMETDDKKDDAAPAHQAQIGVPHHPSVVEMKISALFIKSVPPTVKRAQLVECCKQVEGFTHLVLSDPRTDKKFYRLGWIVFADGTDMEKAHADLNQKKIDDFVLNLALHNAQPLRTRLLPSEFSTAERLAHDLENARRLIKALDQEAELQGLETIENRFQDVVFKGDAFREDAVMVESQAADAEKPVEQSGVAVKKVSGTDVRQTDGFVEKTKLLLDCCIDYLRRVHWYDFYAGIESDGPEDFCRRVWLNLRKSNPAADAIPAGNAKPHQKSDFQRFSERLDSRVVLRTIILEPGSWGGEELEKIGGKNPELEIDRVLSSKHVSRIEQEKFRCRECTKLFRGDEFVRKHIRGKHPEVIGEIRAEVDFFNNYVRDPNRVHYAWNTPNQQAGGMMGASGGMGAMGGGMMGAMGGPMMAGGMGMGMGMGGMMGQPMGIMWVPNQMVGMMAGVNNWDAGGGYGGGGGYG